LLHNTLDQSLNSRPKLAIFSLSLADLVGNKAYRSDVTQMESGSAAYEVESANPTIS
jgi:hypothetical protein